MDPGRERSVGANVGGGKHNTVFVCFQGSVGAEEPASGLCGRKENVGGGFREGRRNGVVFDEDIRSRKGKVPVQELDAKFLEGLKADSSRPLKIDHHHRYPEKQSHAWRDILSSADALIIPDHTYSGIGNDPGGSSCKTSTEASVGQTALIGMLDSLFKSIV
ncbi:MAG: hypothetical protein Q9199_008081 [Rusavskia elegans]